MDHRPRAAGAAKGCEAEAEVGKEPVLLNQLKSMRHITLPLPAPRQPRQPRAVELIPLHQTNADHGKKHI